MTKRLATAEGAVDDATDAIPKSKQAKPTLLEASCPVIRHPFKSCRLRNNSFGAVVDGVRPEALSCPSTSKCLVDLWHDAGGLLIVRGLHGLSPQQLCDFSSCFGRLHASMEVSSSYYIDGYPIMRMGNVKDKDDKLISYLANRRQILEGESLQYNPETKEPNWHTDSVFWEVPPLGSLFYCQQAPGEGGETLFADTTAAFAALPGAQQAELASLEAICSLAHQWAKKNKSAAHKSLARKSRQELLDVRVRSPARRVPLALTHAVTGRVSIYGMNMGTCAVLPKGTTLPDAQMDELELDGVEHESLQILKNLLPHLSQPQFTVKWHWQVGDLVVWDNRSLFHAGTGFDERRYMREMWRTTVLVN